jgi:YaiO family outer membrane protein
VKEVRVGAVVPGRRACVALAFAVALFAGLARDARGEEPEPPPGPWLQVLEVGAGVGSFSSPFGDSDFQYARFSVSKADRQTWRIEGSRASRFSDAGYGVGASFTRFFPGGINFSLGGSTGTGDLIYPDHQIDASLGKAFREKRNLVGSIFYSHSQSKQENSYDRFGLGLVWYKDDHWILSASARTDFGDPGDTTSTSGAVGATYGIYRER